jgi:sulfur-oxidizing protein SoxY
MATRRDVLRTSGRAGLALVSWRLAFGSRSAQSQGLPNDVLPEETVEKTLARLFGARTIGEAQGRIKLDLPTIAENGSNVPVAVEVQSPMTSNDYVKSIYIISDLNRRPMNVRFNLTPAMGAAAVGTNVRLGETTYVRAIAELSNGALLQTKRQVRVLTGGCGG